jgi:hypothetical protein
MHEIWGKNELILGYIPKICFFYKGNKKNINLKSRLKIFPIIAFSILKLFEMKIKNIIKKNC